MGLDLVLELKWKYLWFIGRKATIGVIGYSRKTAPRCDPFMVVADK